MKRRQFLVLTAGGIAIAGAGAGAGLWLFCPDRREPGNARHRLLALIEAMTGVAAVGRAWQQAHPQIDVEQELLMSLGLEAEQLVLHEDFVERLGEQIEADLEEGRIFEYGHWWLAETEARLAALHVAALGPQASEVEAPEFATAPEGRIVRLGSFRPQSVRQGEPITYSGLPDGVIWFGTAAATPPRLRVVIAGRELRISPGANGFSVRIPDALREQLDAAPGEHEIWLYDPIANRRQRLGAFTVREGAPDEAGFCTVERWGPQETRAGQVFNEQPDGAAAFWIRVGCFPPETVVVLNDVELPTTLHPDDGLITTHIADPTLYDTPGSYTLQLLDRDSGATQPVGAFTVHE